MLEIEGIGILLMENTGGSRVGHSFALDGGFMSVERSNDYNDCYDTIMS